VVTREDQPPSSLYAEARLYLEWMRGAGGPLLPADEPAPTGPVRIGRSGTPFSRKTPASRETPGAGAEPAEASARGAGASLARPERAAYLAAMADDVKRCTRCRLSETRTCTVFGEGSQTPQLVIVGEAPGAEEDRTGRPFVGPAGQLLTKMLAAIGLAREDVYICNVLKCRPPGNRNPRPDEVGSCRPFLQEQLTVLNPSLVLALGSPASRELLGTERGIGSLRGRFARTTGGFRVMPTYHPAYLLRNPAAKRDVWNDLKKVAAHLGLQIPPR